MKSVALTGLDRLGMTLADTLSQFGHQVLCIDNDKITVQHIADKVTNAVCANYTNEQALRASGIKSFDSVVICVYDSVDNSLLTVLAVKEPGIGSMVVRAISDDHKRILEELGISDITYPESDMTNKLAYRLNKSKIRQYFEFSSDYSIIEVSVPEKWVVNNLISLKIRSEYGINIIGISRPAKHSVDITVDPMRPLEKDDILVVLVTYETLIKFTKSID